MMMTGALIKTYFVDRLGVKPEDIYSVAVMPCTAKKGEYRRETLKREGQVWRHCFFIRVFLNISRT